MINSRAILLFASAIVAAGGAAYLVKGVLTRPQPAAAVQEQKPPAADPPVRVLVAAKDLPVGALLKPGDLAWQPWPKEGVRQEYVLETPEGMQGFDGAVVRSRLYPGEPISTARALHPGDRGFLAAVLEPGKRAVAVPVDATSVAGGFILPGDRVDLLLTFKRSQTVEGGSGEETRHFSETLLTDVRVLALDQTVDSPNGQAKVAKTATLEVTPKEAESVLIALDIGELSLSLRGLNQLAATLSEPKNLAAAESRGRDGGKRSYTRDIDVLDMVGDPMGLRPPSGLPRAISVLRGSEAKEIRY